MGVSSSGGGVSGRVVINTFIYTIFINLIFFAVILSNFDFFNTGGARLFVRFSGINKLHERSSIVIHNVPIKRIGTLSLERSNILIAISLARPIAVHRKCAVHTRDASLLNNVRLIISANDKSIVRVSRSSPLIKLPPRGIVRGTGRLIASLHNSLGSNNVLAGLRTVITSIHSVATAVESKGNAINGLLSRSGSLCGSLTVAMDGLGRVASHLRENRKAINELLSSSSTPCGRLAGFITGLSVVKTHLREKRNAVKELLSPSSPVTASLTRAFRDLEVVSNHLRHNRNILNELLSPSSPVTTGLTSAVRGFGGVSSHVRGNRNLLKRLVHSSNRIAVRMGNVLGSNQSLLSSVERASPMSAFSSVFVNTFWSTIIRLD